MDRKQLFLDRVAQKFGSEYNVIGDYVNSTTKINVQHNPCGTVMPVAPNHFLEGVYRCPTCRAKEREARFKTKLFDLVGDEFELVGAFKGVDHLTDFKHTVCGRVFQAKPQMMLTTHRCLLCTSLDGKRTSYAKKLQARFGDAYELLDYQPSPGKVTVRHNVCGTVFSASGYRLLNAKNTGCRYCEDRASAHTLEYAKSVFNEAGLELLAETYQDNDTLMPYVCKKHRNAGVQYRTLRGLTRTVCGCAVCAREVAASKIRLSEDYCRQCTENLGYKFVSANIVDNHTEISYICPKHPELGIQAKKANDLINTGKGCPGCSESKGERFVRAYLNEHNLSYVTQKRFDDLRGVHGGMLSYDFWIPSENTLIEFNGAQHYAPATTFSVDKADELFKTQQIHDARKKTYAEQHGINLIVIPYTRIKAVGKILDEVFYG